MFDAAIRLATWLSLAAAALAAAAQLAGVPQEAVVLPVIVVGFATSWVRSGRPEVQPPIATGVTVSAAPRA